MTAEGRQTINTSKGCDDSLIVSSWRPQEIEAAPVPPLLPRKWGDPSRNAPSRGRCSATAWRSSFALPQTGAVAGGGVAAAPPRLLGPQLQLVTRG